MADGLRGATAAFAKQLADPLTAADQIDCAQHRLAAAEPKPLLVEHSAFDAFHGEGDRPARADRIDAELVATLCRAQDGVAVAHATERAERKQAFVLDA